MRGAGDHRQPLVGVGGAHRQSGLAVAVDPPRANPVGAYPKGVADRSVDSAGDWGAVFDQADIDGEITILFDKFFGPVERVNQPKTCPRNFRNVTGGDTFLGNCRNLRGKRGEGWQNHRLGGLVGGGDGRTVRLVVNSEITGVYR